MRKSNKTTAIGAAQVQEQEAQDKQGQMGVKSLVEIQQAALLDDGKTV